MKPFLAVVAFFAVAIGLSWALAYNDLAFQSFFAPRQENVRRHVFEETKSYNQGMVQELENLQAQYITATPEQKAGLRAIILHRAADYPADRLPPDLRSFIDGLR